jgi:predicted nucleotidyltransferase
LQKRKLIHPIIQDHLNTIKAFCEQYKVKSLYAFGSVNTPMFTDKSDIDLLIDFEPGISIEDYTDNFFSLREKFSKLFQRNIDLVTRRSLSNPFFILDVEQSKVLIYG